MQIFVANVRSCKDATQNFEQKTHNCSKIPRFILSRIGKSFIYMSVASWGAFWVLFGCMSWVHFGCISWVLFLLHFVPRVQFLGAFWVHFGCILISAKKHPTFQSRNITSLVMGGLMKSLGPPGMNYKSANGLVWFVKFLIY